MNMINSICKISYQSSLTQEVNQELPCFNSFLNLGTNAFSESPELTVFRSRIRLLKNHLQKVQSRLQILTLCFYRSLVVDKYHQILKSLSPASLLKSNLPKFDLADFLHFLHKFYPSIFKATLNAFILKDLENLTSALQILPHMDPEAILDLKYILQREHPHLTDTLLKVYTLCTNLEDKKIYVKDLLQIPLETSEEFLLIKGTLFAKYLVERITPTPYYSIIPLQNILKEFPETFILNFLQSDIYRLDFLKAQFALRTMRMIKDKELVSIRPLYLKHLASVIKGNTLENFIKTIEKLVADIQKLLSHKPHLRTVVQRSGCPWTKEIGKDLLLKRLFQSQKDHNHPLLEPYPNLSEAEFYALEQEEFSELLSEASQIFGETFSCEPAAIREIFTSDKKIPLDNFQAYFVGYLLLIFYEKSLHHDESLKFMDPLLAFFPQSLLQSFLKLPSVNHFIFLLQNLFCAHLFQQNMVGDEDFLEDFAEYTQVFKMDCMDSLAENLAAVGISSLMFHHHAFLKTLREHSDHPSLQILKQFLPYSLKHYQDHLFHLSQIQGFHPKSFYNSFEHCLNHFDEEELKIGVSFWDEQDQCALLIDLLRKSQNHSKQTQKFLEIIKTWIKEGHFELDFMANNIHSFPQDIIFEAFELIPFRTTHIDTAFRNIKKGSSDFQSYFLKRIHQKLSHIRYEIQFLMDGFEETLSENKLPSMITSQGSLLEFLLQNNDKKWQLNTLQTYLGMFNLEKISLNESISPQYLHNKILKISNLIYLQHQLLSRLEVHYPLHFLKCVCSKGLLYQINPAIFLKAFNIALVDDQFKELTTAQIIDLNEQFCELTFKYTHQEIHYAKLAKSYHLDLDLFPKEGFNPDYYAWIFNTHLKFLQSLSDKDLKELGDKLKHTYRNFPNFPNSELAKFIEKKGT